MTDRAQVGSTRFTIALVILAVLTVVWSGLVVVGIVTAQPELALPAAIGAVGSAVILGFAWWSDRRGTPNPLSWLPAKHED